MVYGSQAPFDCRGFRPTVCTYPTKLRGENILRHLKDSVFREMGPCIHSFNLKIPAFIRSDVTDRHPPIEDAHVHSIDGSVDAGTPNGPVPAVTKWILDELDELKYYSEHVQPESQSIGELTEECHTQYVNTYRGFDSPILQNRMHYCTASRTIDNSSEWEPDLWEAAESEALAHQIHTLSLLGIAYDLNITDATLHGTFIINNIPFEIVAIRGNTHDEVLAHADNQLIGFNHSTIVISRDNENSHTNHKELKKFTCADDSESSKGMQFTDPVGNSRFRDFASCLDVWQRYITVDKLEKPKRLRI